MSLFKQFISVKNIYVLSQICRTSRVNTVCLLVSRVCSVKSTRAHRNCFFILFWKETNTFFFADTKDFKNNFLLIVLLLGWNIPLRTLHALKTVCWNWRIDVSDCCRFFWWFLLWIFTYFLVNTFFILYQKLKHDTKNWKTKRNKVWYRIYFRNWKINRKLMSQQDYELKRP